MGVFERVRKSITTQQAQGGHAMTNRQNIVSLRIAKEEIEKMLYRYVVKERYRGEWVNTYFQSKKAAVKLCSKIIQKGGRAVWMKNAC